MLARSAVPSFLLLTVLGLPAQDRPAKPTRRLPRVLLIGDSISIGYTKPVQELLRGKAEVHRVKGNAGDTGRGLERIEDWLSPENGKWDVIHFNWGLWDLCYRPKSGRGRDKVNGTITHEVEDYGRNLDKLAARLEKTGADLIFALTTPVPEGEPGRKVGDDLLYNDAAMRIMASRGIAIDDLYSVAAGRMKELARAPGDVHFTKHGYELLAAQVARSVLRQLAQRDTGKRPRGSPSPKWTPTRKLVYKHASNVDLHLHVFEPDHHRPDAAQPAIVFFFGGGWNGGSPTQFYPHCSYLAGRYMVAISAEYRVKSRNGTTPFDCVADGKSAIRWIRAHAKRLGIDPNRIAAGGGSAGGHIAAAVATVPGLDDPADDTSVSCRPNALVLFNPVYDNGPGGYGYKRVKDRFREISPLHNLSTTTPPTVVFLGTNDKLVPVATAEKFRDKMLELGCKSVLHLYEGRGHGFFNHGRGDGSDYRRTVYQMDVFLESLGYLFGKPTLRVRAGRK